VIAHRTGLGCFIVLAGKFSNGITICYSMPAVNVTTKQ